MASQGAVAAALAVGTCLVYEKGSDTFKETACNVIVAATPFGSFALIGKALMVTSKVGHVYRLGKLMYNTGMYPAKLVHFFMQAPLMALDVLMIGEPYVPHGNATLWSIGNITDDAETVAKWAINHAK